MWRSHPLGRVGYVIPMTVVLDDADVTVLFQHAGSVCKNPTGTRGGAQGRTLIEWAGGHEDRVFPGPPTLRLHMWGTAHAVIRRWSFDHDCAYGWYVNPEQPWIRTPIGFDSRDDTLDVTVQDDLSSWALKDEDELEWKVESGALSAPEAEAIRAEAERAIASLERRAWPFVDDWSRLRPDPAWPIPRVLPGWDTR